MKADQAVSQETEAKEAFAGIAARHSELLKSREFSSAEEAKELLKKAEQKKREAEEKAKNAKTSREKAQADVEGAKTRIEEYQKELPKREKQRADRLAAYEKGIEEAGLTEEAWRALTDQYALSEADRLQKETEEYYRNHAKLSGRQQMAAKETAGKEAPDPEGLKEKMREAEEKKNAVQKISGQLEAAEAANRQVLRSLAQLLKERGAKMEEYGRVDRLYQSLSGNVFFQWCAAAGAAVLILHYGVTDNIGYSNLQKRYEKTYAYCIRLLDRIEQTQGYYQGIPIAMVGVVGDEQFPATDITGDVTSNMIGLNGDILLYTGENYQAFMKNYLGATLNFLPSEAMEEIYFSEEYKEMESFPGKTSTKVVDGILYVKTENMTR